MMDGYALPRREDQEPIMGMDRVDETHHRDIGRTTGLRLASGTPAPGTRFSHTHVVFSCRRFPASS
jgi:hypothetical protein